MLRAATERILHLAIESCINIGNRLIAIIQFDEPIEAPETYADIFVQLRSLGIIEADLADSLIDMARFRNRLVHMYWDIDIDAVCTMLQEDLGDFKRLQDAVVTYLNGRIAGETTEPSS